ncbi:cell division protein PerM [Pseudokineococcus sp. 1T1Z-3]|uniref:cell division protein PerM n=1 Tax=Pseudokineococcus sp. 1T1Z-3 TaxID=3132745 RepID=UPI00309AF5D3
MSERTRPSGASDVDDEPAEELDDLLGAETEDPGGEEVDELRDEEVDEEPSEARGRAGTPAVVTAGRARSRGDAAPGGSAVLTSPALLGLLAGAQAVLGSLLCVVGPVAATWLVASRTGATWDDALRIAADGWLLASGAVLAVPGGRVGLWPLGLALLPVAWFVSAGRRTAVALEETHPAGRARRDGLDGALVAALLGVVASSVVLAVVVALLAGSPVVRPVLGTVVLGTALVAGASSGLAMAAARLRLAAAHPSRTRRPAGRPGPPVGRTPVGRAPAREASGDVGLPGALADLVRLPAPGRAVVAAGARSLLLCLLGAAVVLVVSLVAGAARVADLHQALDAGAVGGVVLVAGQLLLLPTALVWSLSWVAGPGFAVGEGTAVTPGSTELGALPALPMLGGLPEQGMGGGALWVVLLLPVAAGAVAVLRLRRAEPLLRPDPGEVVGTRWQRTRDELARRWRPALVRSSGVGAVAGAGAALLAAASSGPVGPGVLAVVGPVWWQTGAALGGLVLAGATLCLLLPGWRHLRGA